MPFYKISAGETIRRDKLSLYIFVISIIAVLAQVSLILNSSGKLPPQVPLFYSRPWGEQMLADSNFLWILPTITLISTAVNFSVSSFFLKEDKFLTKVLAIFCLLVAFTNTYNLVKIISLVS